MKALFAALACLSFVLNPNCSLKSIDSPIVHSQEKSIQQVSKNPTGSESIKPQWRPSPYTHF